MTAPVVVGVDGSAASTAAVALAVRTAVERDRPLRVVHGFVWPLLRVPLGPSPYGPPEGGLRNDAEQIVRDALACAEGCDPRVRASGEVVTGGVAAVLVGESRHAYALVLGARGLGGFTGLLVGSVGVQVAAHAACPVLVARGAPRENGPVVVGVDGSPNSNRAVAFAAQEAVLRKTDLRAVHVWSGPSSTGPGDMLPLVYDPEQVAEEESRLLFEATAGLTERYPDLLVGHRVVHGRAARAMVAQSQGAQLVVVGARGRGGFAGLLLGSVSQALLHHADCPVAVVRPATA
ncbi:universal stress protein [Phytohabitans sp. ZYX-F-186]|uniref:Universal stress protein n=1 Tax=Phytohabitans maris TaxID=3071409 RepID=A0ABU0ZTN7_9ACTN|nr:universal stress protein [Phytohabitans sp. ZYX-F-186]MDQ7910409.1 universal stress protein [Phytohabitans sp. ZYX-F-186]